MSVPRANAPSRAYRGVSADDRRDQRRALLVEATLDCLHAEGLAGVGVRSVCARARLTPRYFYESFGDLDALLVATVDSVIDEVAQASLAAVVAAPEGIETRTRAAIDAGYGVVIGDRRKGTVLLVVSAGHGPLRERRHQMVLDFANLLIENIGLLPELGRPARDVIRMKALFVMGGSAEAFEAALSGRVRMSRRRVVDQLTTMWLGALQAPA